MEDSSNPFYLHNGDHPRLILVSHHLSRSNYNTQSRAMMMALMTKNKVGFIDGCISWFASDNLLFNAKSRYNSLVISWLLNSISKEILESIMYMGSAHEIWTNLRDRFH
ncbi:hypothetical protein PVL29_012045 [Vitis rotundifolia]|uniref:Retrotransposon Copia-like N-terminal domain-containing protein n=1 Tax=Vitis rotundifolia TaxID=103349 RepID=A0AA38ZRN4_VITRO|nr:hypothetical protein PVL29_012045 [Vitis rotundifolia]